jgi:mannose-6-phosphate isomerase-like protein (cupin superfamily)
MHPPQSIPNVLSKITRAYEPHLIASINNHHLKLAKIDGPFIWHAHNNTDELFHVLSGVLTMELEGQDAVVLNGGDVFVVPVGVRHRPIGNNAEVLMIEKEGTVNTGDEVGSERTVEAKDIRGNV